MNKEKLSRRSFFKGSLALSGVVAGLSHGLEPTPAQTPGPFYPVDGINRDHDLTTKENLEVSSTLERIYLHGSVLDIDDQKLEKAVVELWQADSKGIYNHTGDPNSPHADPKFQFWGRYVTNADGRFYFKTIKPRKYDIGGGNFRTPHLHFRILKRGFEQLVTQLYFDDEVTLNETDIVFKRIPINERERVITELAKPSSTSSNIQKELLDSFGQSEFENNARIGEFNIGLTKFM